MTRQRSITALSAISVDSYHFRLRLTTQAGAYVKEFVHGDFGRTKPNLTMILERFVDIIELDVLVCNEILLNIYLIFSFIGS
jgi:tRNA pseudouridine synthase 10